MQQINDILITLRQAQDPLLMVFYDTSTVTFPTQTMAVEEAVSEYPQIVRMITVDTANMPDISQHFKITGIPTVMLYIRGEFRYSSTGYCTKQSVFEMLDSHISPAFRGACSLRVEPPPAMNYINHSDSTVRRTAAWLLGDSIRTNAVDGLITLLGDPDIAVRLEAVRSLGRHYDLRAVEPLLNLFQRETSICQGISAEYGQDSSFINTDQTALYYEEFDVLASTVAALRAITGNKEGKDDESNIGIASVRGWKHWWASNRDQVLHQDRYRRFFQSVVNNLYWQNAVPFLRVQHRGTWHSFPSTTKGFDYRVRFTIQNTVRLELHIDIGDKEKNKRAFSALHDEKAQIESEFQESLCWDRMESRRGSRICMYHEGYIDLPEVSLEKTTLWIVSTFMQFITIFERRIGEGLFS